MSIVKAENTIPILVGITGHRTIRKQDYDAIYTSVKTELGKLRNRCPNSRVVLLTSLAEGGDLLCAEAAAELDIPLIVVLPDERDIYEKDFSTEAKERFRFHCERAEQLFTAPFTEKVPESGISRAYRFRQAGIYVAAHCHVLLALWDGGPGTAAACGTAEAVDFALNGSYQPEKGAALSAEGSNAVIQIFTPRGERTEEAAGTVHFLGNSEALWKILRETDDFNRQAKATETGTKSRLPSETSGDVLLEKMERLGLTAGKLSTAYAKKYRLILALLAVASALLTFAFLLYDEAQAIWMILVCGFLLIAAWSFQRYAARSDCHRRYIEYRALAESLRVQTYLRYAGSLVEAADLLSWTQREETAWITAALRALTTGDIPKEKQDIRICWVEEQRSYHQEKGKQSMKRIAVSERIVHTAFILSILLYCAALVFELLGGGLIFKPLIKIPDVEIVRTFLKIVLGTISAVTLFTANFYGRLSLPRTCSDHEKMERFYGKMSALLLQYGQTEELLTVLAREELTENGNWVSYQRDNKPDISI